MKIEESGMIFNADDQDSKVYHIEKSKLYEKIIDGVKVCEFLLLDGDKCKIIEAKKSAPNPNNKEDGNEKNYEVFIDDINAKFINSFSMFIANKIKRHNIEKYDEMSELFKKSKLSKLDFSFILIIKGSQTEWLSPVSDSLKNKMRGFIRSWNINDINIKVLNEELARQKNLIQ